MSNARTRGKTKSFIVAGIDCIDKIELKNIDKQNGFITMSRRSFNHIIKFILHKRQQALIFDNPILKVGLANIEKSSSVPIIIGQSRVPVYDLGIVAIRLFCYHFNVCNHFEGVHYQVIVKSKL
jgi:hypothetical protein